MYIQNRLGLIEATETMQAHTNRLNQVSNNLANVDTAGFKGEDQTFWEMLFTTNSNQPRVGKAINEVTDMSEGSLMATGNPLDLAIAGKGFFKIQTPEGVRYSRAGDFHQNSTGQLATPAGHLVLGEGGPIIINGQDISVAIDGSITVDGLQAGKLAIADFADPSELQKAGERLFSKSADTQELEAGDFQLQQGFIEKSNVNNMKELTKMLDLQRAYQAQQKIIRTFDDVDEQAISRVGRLGS